MYQEKSLHEHILLRPDAYIGSIKEHTQPLWVFEKGEMVYRRTTYVPGLCKIFEEILMNAVDNKRTDPSMDSIIVKIDVDQNTISVRNNGNGVPVAQLEEKNVYIPELVFGCLLTSSHFDDNTTGGRTGYGAKLTNIFSTRFTIETADGKNKFKQVFTRNMKEKSTPLVTTCESIDKWTEVTFEPDLEMFHISKIGKDTVALMEKRIVECAACLGETVKVTINDTLLEVNSFNDYVDLYLGANSSRNDPLPRMTVKVNDKWEICVSLSKDKFQQISFVNSIATTKGGPHVDYVTTQIIDFITNSVKKKKNYAKVETDNVKKHMWVFVNCVIDHPDYPVFDWLKETLIFPESSFGSKCKLSKDILKKDENPGMVKQLLSWATSKHGKDLDLGIEKLVDANKAGGEDSKLCTLILTEGDSAKTLVMTGLSFLSDESRELYGVFPLQGKLMNVRGASEDKINKNQKIQQLKTILGLENGKEYGNLRYGHVMIMTDQDHDGFHIKGLIINLFHVMWPELLERDPSFLCEFVTPIVKATHEDGKKETFLSMPELKKWKNNLLPNDIPRWTYKTYKGLGTSSDEEAQTYFENISIHKRDFLWQNEDDGKAIDLAFNSDKPEDRRTWLKNYTSDTHLDRTGLQKIRYSEFINKELILFSKEDNRRSIPEMIDGLKPGQRKTLFCSLARDWKTECKVSVLTAHAIDRSDYNHGEQSLASTIIKMAQDYVGSSNVNLLLPMGQFGSQIFGGQDAASARYLYTMISPATRALFHKDDDVLLAWMDGDNQRMIEPKWYIPIIPTVLVNGCEGIGTGWSTFVPKYSTKDVIKNIMRLMSGEALEPMVPSYRGFKGTITETEGGFITKGVFEKNIQNSTIRITELPIKHLSNYKKFLHVLKTEEKFIKEIRDNSSRSSIDILLTLSRENMEIADEDIYTKLKLRTKILTTNMNLFDPTSQEEIKKYGSPLDILREFYTIRCHYYQQRLGAMVTCLSDKMIRLQNKVKFVHEVLSGELKVNNRPEAELVNELRERKYDSFDSGYVYLLGEVNMRTLGAEKVKELNAELEKVNEERDVLLSTNFLDMWRSDIKDLEKELEKLIPEVTKKADGKFSLVYSRRKKKQLGDKI